MRKYLIISFLLIYSLAGAQFDFLYRQFVLNQICINPAYTGSREIFVVANQSRLQWAGMKGAPRTTVISADTPLKGKKVALGLSLSHEQIGNTSNNSIQTNYAFRINTRAGTFSLGLKAAANIFTIRELENVDFVNETVFSAGNQTYIMPDFGAGLYFYDYNKYFIGFSVPSFLNYVGGTGENGYQIDYNIKYYDWLGSAGVLIRFSDHFKWRLSTLAAYNLISSFSADVNSMFIINNLIWFGGSYYTEGITTFMAQVQVNPQLKIGFAYDYSLGRMKQLNGSYELMIRYEFSYIIKAVSPLF